MTPAEKTERNRRMLVARRDGATWPELAREHGLSTRQVARVLAEAIDAEFALAWADDEEPPGSRWHAVDRAVRRLQTARG